MDKKLLWSRREIIKTASLAALGYPALQFTSCINRTGEIAATGSPDLTIPDWVSAGKLRWVWALWEPIDLYRRSGSAAGIGDGRATGHWVLKWYERMHSDEILDKLADIGINLVSTHFYKGFGLKAEAEEMQRAADFTKRAHLRGIRVLGYHQFSTVIYETLKDEIPKLEDWIQLNPDGSMRTYGGGATYWRWLACPTHDDFIKYLKKVVDHTLIYADMDGVEYDGTDYNCHCEKCQKAFREYLKENNPDPQDRFGLPHFNHVRIPTSWNTKDPLWQEWIRFKIYFMGKRLRELRTYIHSKKQGAILATYEDCPALWRNNRTRGMPDKGDYLDLAIAESHDMPQIQNGELITKIRHLKEANAIGQIGLSTDWLRSESGGILLPNETKPVELDMAECMACGGHVLTATWALRSGNKRDGSAFFEQTDFYNVMKQYMQFSKKYENLQEGIQGCANVWVYHSQWSLAFDFRTAYNSILGFEQALLGRIAYRVAKETDLNSLTGKDILILANQTCLSEKECNEIRSAANRGCGIIITGKTSECDENFRQFPQPVLNDIYNKSNVRYFEKCPGVSAKISSTGNLTPVMPKRFKEIILTVKELASQNLAVEIDSGDKRQPDLYVDIYKQPDNSITHILYYGVEDPKGLKLRIAEWLPNESPVLYSPYLNDPVKLQKQPDGWISLPSEMGKYGIVKCS